MSIKHVFAKIVKQKMLNTYITLKRKSIQNYNTFLQNYCLCIINLKSIMYFLKKPEAFFFFLEYILLQFLIDNYVMCFLLYKHFFLFLVQNTIFCIHIVSFYLLKRPQK